MYLCDTTVIIKTSFESHEFESILQTANLGMTHKKIKCFLVVVPLSPVGLPPPRP